MRRPVGVKGIRFGFCWSRCFSRRVATVAMLPSALFEERLSSLGASWAFSFQPVLPSDYRPRFHLEDESWARRLTQSPELGFRLWSFPFRRLIWFCFGFTQLRPSSFGCCCATVRTLLRSPTGDAATRPAFAPVAIMARFFPLFPPRSASFRPQRRRSQSTPNGPRMWCAPCTSSVRR